MFDFIYESFSTHSEYGCQGLQTFIKHCLIWTTTHWVTVCSVPKQQWFNENMIYLKGFNMCNYRSATRALNHQTPGLTFQARGALYPSWGTRRTICSPTCILAPPTWSLFGRAPPKASAKQLSLRSPPTSLVRTAYGCFWGLTCKTVCKTGHIYFMSDPSVGP